MVDEIPFRTKNHRRMTLKPFRIQCRNLTKHVNMWISTINKDIRCLLERHHLKSKVQLGKLTWNPKTEVWKLISVFNWMIFRFHLQFSRVWFSQQHLFWGGYICSPLSVGLYPAFPVRSIWFRSTRWRSGCVEGRKRQVPSLKLTYISLRCTPPTQ